MYAFEIATSLLFLSFIVSLIFFAFLVVSSLIEERWRKTAGQDSLVQPAVAPARRPSSVPSSKPAT